jgi:maltose-binding protein MalE
VKWSLAALACLGLLAWTGCGRQDTRTALTLWHTKSGQERKLLESALAEYQQAHPGVRVEALNRDPEELRNLYVIAAVAGQGPDLVYGAADNVGVFVTTQTIQPLDAALPPEFTARFTPHGIVSWNGTNWLAADKVGDHLMLIYNRKLVPKPPATLSELVAIATDLTRDTDGNGSVDQYGLVWNYVEPFFFVPFLTGFGAWLMDDAGHPTLDQPGTAAAIQFVLDLRNKHKAIPAETDYTISDSLFKEGRAAMIINGPWAWPDYKLPDFAMIAPLPVNDLPGYEGTPCRPIIAANGYCLNVNLTGERRAAAAALLDFLTSRAVQERMSRELRTFPSDRAFAESDAVRLDPVLSLSGRQIASGIPMPIRPQLRQIWDGMRGPYQRVMQGGVSASDGARLMQLECEKLIKDAQL